MVRTTGSIICFCICWILISCNGSKKSQLPRQGELVAKDSILIVGDSLNRNQFSIEIKADSQIEKGVYDIFAKWSTVTVRGGFTMPNGAEDVVPILKRSKKPNAFIIGFKLNKDTTFYDYVEVSGSAEAIKILYLSSYSFK